MAPNEHEDRLALIQSTARFSFRFLNLGRVLLPFASCPGSEDRSSVLMLTRWTYREVRLALVLAHYTTPFALFHSTSLERKIDSETFCLREDKKYLEGVNVETHVCQTTPAAQERREYRFCAAP